MNGLLEILTNKEWMIRPDFVHSIRSVFQNNLAGHVELGEEKKELGCRIVFTKEGTEARIKEERYSAKDGRYISYYNDNKDDPFINVMFIDGPITRNGGACSYGSVQHRDMMMKAADNANCVGHIFHINTPGGSAWAKNDYQQGIDYAHEKNQPVIAFIDGMCCSAGMYLAALCDERYYMHPKDEIGCIGVMAAFYTEADGGKNQYTDETYHELYDPESYDKNKEFRDIANDNDAKLLIEQLTKLGVEFRADVKAHCPMAEDKHLHGKVFDAKDVEGTLMDGQKSLGEVFNIVVERGVKNGLQSALNAQASYNEMIKNMKKTSTTLNNTINMKEKFPAVFALLGVEEMQMQEGGAFMNEGLLATLNAAIEAKQKETADAKALADQLTAEKAELEQKVNDLNAQVETANSEHKTAIEKMEGEHKAAIEEKDNQIATLEQEKADKVGEIEFKDTEIAKLQSDFDGAKASLETAQKAIAEKDQKITDLEAENAELKNDPGEGAKGGQSPKNNGEGAEAQEVAVKSYVYDNSLSYEENMKRKAEFESK